jgi:5-methyltetrahydropteroyltriglutamate--homocysteine methyltransferase
MSEQRGPTGQVMATRSGPPFRADHVGSLLRPEQLHRARAEFKAGRIDHAALRGIEDRAILDAIELQRSAGIRTITDGEFRRTSWHMDFIYQLQGVTQVQGESLHVQFKNEQGEYDYAPPAMRVSGKIDLGQTIFGDDYRFVQDRVQPGECAKLTIPSPSMVHYRGGNSSIDENAYPDIDQFWEDLAEAYAKQVRGVYELGCRFLQLDDTSLAYVNDPAQRVHIAAIGGDPNHLHEQYISVINRAIADRPGDLRVGTHLCRGNNQSMWAAEGGYDFVADALFNDLNVDAYYLEFDDERSGTFEPLRHVPAGKTVVLGIVTTKRPELEDKDFLKRRIDDAARYLDLEQICISGQCGFASTEEGNRLTIDEEKAKLELLVEVADEVWGT